MKRTTFELIGATCTSCVIGIEHMGRRIKGVEDIVVDRTNGEIYLDFDGDPTTEEKIVRFIQAIGYDATVKESATPTA